MDLDADGRQASNGAPEQVATGAAADEPVVTTAQEVSCGDLVARAPTPDRSSRSSGHSRPENDPARPSIRACAASSSPGATAHSSRSPLTAVSTVRSDCAA